jgi:predicted ATPase
VTPFVGRKAEIHELAQLIADSNVRLVTILAPGGMGKTRLALKVAEQQLDNFADGVFFVPLQALGSFDDQLISVLRHFIGMLREGYSILQCFQFVAENAPTILFSVDDIHHNFSTSL